MSKVFLHRINKNVGLRDLEEKIGGIVEKKFETEDSVALKLHFGERKSDTHLDPGFVETLYKKIPAEQKCLMDCTVLYKGDRSFADTHKEVAKDNGFNFGNIVIADGQNGTEENKISIENGKYFEDVKIGKKLENYSSLLVVTHFTGHVANGIGGALKNVGMGLGSKGGKLEMHNAFNLEVNKSMCTGCKTCILNCPEDAISIKNGKAEIDHEKCIGCGQCISVCPENAVKIPWGDSSSIELQEKIAEYAEGALKDKKCLFITVLKDITRDCDCTNRKQEKIIEDIGVLVSEDPVAIDQAAVDLVEEKGFKSRIDYSRQISHAEKIGMGKREYIIEEI